jgi:hypothetical protein
MLALSERAGLDFAGPLQTSLSEEEAMATWIVSRVKDVTLQYLARRERAA